MKRKIFALFTILCLCAVVFLSCQKKAAETKVERTYFLEQVGDTQIVRLYADGFNELSPNEKLLAYYLSQAAISGRDINYDQSNIFDLEIRNLMEEILLHSEGLAPEVLKKITDYTKLVWANNSHYNATSGVKIIPEFSFAELTQAATNALTKGADFAVKDENELKEKLARLEKAIFDPQFEPLLTNKAPAAGEDLITGSANNLYHDVTLAEVEKLDEKYPLNSRVDKVNGKVVEQVYRAGTDGIPAGLYAKELKNVIANLEKALPYAAEHQKETLEQLITYFKTGDPQDFRKYNISWVTDDPPVDTINGFIEVYLDARGMKGEYEGLVYFIDRKTTKMMKDLANEAQYFEDRMPWDEKYKKTHVQVPVSNSINVIMGIGGTGPIPPIGINLPNPQDIREQYGSKNVLLTNVIRNAGEATGSRAVEEFGLTQEEIDLSKKYGGLAGEVVTALHEIIGHGSGKVEPTLTEDPSVYLKEYYSTLEEARADLAALYHIWDNKLIELGVIPNLDVAKAAYYGYARNDIVQLRRVRTGDRIEEDHMRDRHMIVNYLREVTKAVEPVEKDGKIYMKVVDMQKMRDGVGELLAKLMKIKATGDYKAAKELIDTYGIKINTAWRDQVIKRCEALHYPNYTAFVMPRLTLVKNDSGEIVDVVVHYDEDFQTQMLRFSGKLK
jgi:dipeptidyl-peptidase-3